MGVNMFYNYSNFKLCKKENFVAITADVECILERMEDDNIWKHQSCDFMWKIVSDKLPLLNQDLYHIVTTKILNHNAVTDYKKIWKLGGFKECGAFDGHYDCKNGRIYFGIYKGSFLSNQKAEIKEVSLFVSQNTDIPFENVFSVFKKHCFDGDQEEKNLIVTCFHLMDVMNALDENSIIIYNSPVLAKIYIFGKEIEKKFNDIDLPRANIIER